MAGEVLATHRGHGSTSRLDLRPPRFTLLRSFVRVVPGCIGRLILQPILLCFDPLWRGERRRRQGLVDPGCRRQRRRDWHPAREAPRVRLVGGAQNLGAPLPLGRGQTIVDVVGGHQAQGTVPVLGVVPREEALAENLGVLVRPEPSREVRPVLEGLELRLGEGVVVGDVRAAVRAWSRRGRPAARPRAWTSSTRRGRHGCVSWPGPMSCRAQVSAMSRSASAAALAMRHHPADDVAAEDVEHHVEVVVGPLRRAQELGDVPAPDLVGAQWRAAPASVRGVAQLVAPLAHLAFAASTRDNRPT